MTYLSNLLQDLWTKTYLWGIKTKTLSRQGPNRVWFQKFFGFLNTLA